MSKAWNHIKTMEIWGPDGRVWEPTGGVWGPTSRVWESARGGTDGRTDGRTDGISPHSTGLRPLSGPLPKKSISCLKNKQLSLSPFPHFLFRIHIMPTMNPDGYARAHEGDYESVRGRPNAHGKDLNRNFPNRFLVWEVLSAEFSFETSLVLIWVDWSSPRCQPLGVFVPFLIA